MDFFTQLRERGIPVTQVEVDYKRNVLHVDIQWFRWDTKFNVSMEVDYEVVIRQPDVAIVLIDNHYRAEMEKQEAAMTQAGNYLISTAGSNTTNAFYDTFNRSQRVNPGGWYETSGAGPWSKQNIESEKKALRYEFEKEARELARKEAMILEETRRLAQEKEEKDAIASILETAKKRSPLEDQKDDTGQQ